MKIIVLSSTKYKENDIIYNGISKAEFLSFKAPGGLSGKSQVMWLNNPLTVAEVEFADRRYKYPTLKEGKLLMSPLSGNDPLEKLIALQVVTEAANNLLSDEEKQFLFDDIEMLLTSLKENKDYLMLVLIFLARTVKYSGSNPQVDECVYCGSKQNITDFSFREGGFICENCLKDFEDITHFSAGQKLLIRYIFKSPNYSCVGAEKFSEEDKFVVLKHLEEFIADELGVSLKSVKNLYK